MKFILLLILFSFASIASDQKSYINMDDIEKNMEKAKIFIVYLTSTQMAVNKSKDETTTDGSIDIEALTKKIESFNELKSTIVSDTPEPKITRRFLGAAMNGIHNYHELWSPDLHQNSLQKFVDGESLDLELIKLGEWVSNKSFKKIFKEFPPDRFCSFYDERLTNLIKNFKFLSY